MNRTTLSIGLVAIGVSLCVVSQSSESACAVSMAELDATAGGQPFFCGSILTDPAGHACNDCLTDNNGGSVKCNVMSNPADETVQYTQGQMPPLMCTSDDPECGDGGALAFYYTTTNCSGDPVDTRMCHRPWHRWMCSPATGGVTCP